MYNIYALATHFATRTLYTGAGLYTDNTFLVGQKIHDIEELCGEGTSRNRSLVNTRNEPHVEKGSPFKRLHVVPGDANISPWALRMKFGSTSLVLRLLEESHESVADLLLHDPLSAARTVGGGVEGMFSPLRLFNSSKTMNALEIQEELALRALNLSERVELPQDEQGIIREIVEIVDALRRYKQTNDPQEKMGQTDWYQKMLFLESVRDRRGGVIADGVELMYDRLFDGVGFRLRESGSFAKYAPPKQAIDEAMKVAPPGRARLRGKFIERAYDIQLEKKQPGLYAIGWGSFTSRLDSGMRKEIELPLKPVNDEEIEEIVVDFFGESDG